MSDLPQVYRKYELLFTPHLIPQLRNLRGEAWKKLVDKLSALPDTHPDALSFAMMMVELGGCLTCEMDSYRAQRGCATCSRQTIISFKEDDTQLLELYETARQAVHGQLSEDENLKKAA